MTGMPPEWRPYYEITPEPPAPPPSTGHRAPDGRGWGKVLAAAVIGAAIAVGAMIGFSKIGHHGSSPASQASSTAAAASSAVTSPVASSSSPATFTVHGSITLVGPYSNSATNTPGEVCTPVPGYNDLSPGAAVTLSDPQGHVVATGALQAGVVVESQTGNGHPDCRFVFEIDDVPADLTLYGFTIGHRSTIELPRSEVATEVLLTLGAT